MTKYLVQRVLMPYLLKAPLQLQKELHLERCLFLDIFACQKRLSHKDVEILDHTCEITNYNDYRMNYKPIICVVVQTLKEILNTSTHDINKMLTLYPQLKKKSRANILNNYYNLLEVGIQRNIITKNIWLLAHDDIKLKEKLNSIRTLDMNNEELIPLLRFTHNELVNYINYIRTDPVPYTYNKIEYLAHRLECSIEEFCKLAVRYTFILKKPVFYIDKKLNVLHEYNVSNKNILKDLWVLQYSEYNIRYRCELYKDTGNIEIKPWAVRCPLSLVKRTIERNYTSRDILQNFNNINEYLLSKLCIKKEELKKFITKWPNILRVNPRKLDKIITILHENDITSQEIIQSAERIFFFDLQTIQKRVEILKKENIPVKIPTLKMSEKLFERYLEMSKRRNELREFYPDNKKYLMRKLNIDEKTFEMFIERWPHAKKKNVLRLEELINMLYQYNFTSYEILTHGRIINFKIETLRERIEILKEAGVTQKITAILFSKKDFDNFVRSCKVNK